MFRASPCQRAGCVGGVDGVGGVGGVGVWVWEATTRRATPC